MNLISCKSNYRERINGNFSEALSSGEITQPKQWSLVEPTISVGAHLYKSLETHMFGKNTSLSCKGPTTVGRTNDHWW